MRWLVPMKLPSKVLKSLKLYDGGAFGSPGTGRPWPGSLHTVLVGAAGSRKQVQPAATNLSGVTPCAVAAPTAASEIDAAAMNSASDTRIVRLMTPPLVAVAQVCACCRVIVKRASLHRAKRAEPRLHEKYREPKIERPFNLA